MELRHLRYFCAVAEQQSMSRAAELLPVAQPALSRQMRDLEEELGAKLFVRQSNGIRLTDAGALFLQHAQRILAQVSIAQTALAELTKGNGGEFIIGGDWRMPVDLIPVAVRELRQRFPKVAITLVELPMHEQMAALRERRIHIGFIPFNMFSVEDAMETRPIVHGEIVAILPAQHPLAHEESVDISLLEKDTWIALDERAFPGVRQAFKRILKPFNVNPHIEPVASSMEGIFARVAAGEGIALFPKILTQGTHIHVKTVPVNGFMFQLCAVWPKNASSPLVSTLLEMIESSLHLEDKKAAKP